MFKNASIYKLAHPEQLDGLEDTLDQAKFLPVGDGLKSFGWAEVRGDELCLKSHGHILLRFMIEKKVIPSSALKRAFAERCRETEDEQGFAPGKVQKREILERVHDELASNALTTRAATWVWLDAARGRLVIDSTVGGTLDLIQRALMVTSGIELTSHEHWAGRMMTHWLMDEDTLPYGYTIDDAVQMEYPGERHTAVAFKKADLAETKVRIHADQGAIVTKLALTFKSRISFALLPIHQLRSIKLLDVTKERQVAADADSQENDFILTALELQALIDDLTEEI